MSSTTCLCHQKPNSKVGCDSTLTMRQEILTPFPVGGTDAVKFSSTAVGDKVMKDIRPGVPFEPTYIYRLLTLIKSSLSEKVSCAATACVTLKIDKCCKTCFFILMITLQEQTVLEGGVHLCAFIFLTAHLNKSNSCSRHAESILIQF